MQVSVCEVSVSQFVLSLEAFKTVLTKAKSFADAKKLDMSVLFQTRLIADQFPLAKQIQMATDTAKGCAARLSGRENPKFEDNETTYEEFMARIDKTIGFLKEFKTEDFKNYEAQTIRFPFYPGVNLDGKSYLITHAIPNFYFHITTSYAILRANGVEIGKKDYLGAQPWKKD